MGYTTEFCGEFKLNKPLDDKLRTTLLEFSETRHDRSGYPGIWCQWVPNEDGTCIEWDEGEKFYNYVEWLQYLISNFLQPNGYTLNGESEWQGEEHDDVGTIFVKNNEITVKQATMTYEDVDALLEENEKLKNELAEALLLVDQKNEDITD